MSTLSYPSKIHLEVHEYVTWTIIPDTVAKPQSTPSLVWGFVFVSLVLMRFRRTLAGELGVCVPDQGCPMHGTHSDEWRGPSLPHPQHWLTRPQHGENRLLCC